MSNDTVRSALNEVLRDHAHRPVWSGPDGSREESPGDPIGRDHADAARTDLREIVQRGLRSGPATPLAPARASALKRMALDNPR